MKISILLAFPSMGILLLLSMVFRKDTFKVICGTFLGRLARIRIGHDNSGLGPGWFLNKVWTLKCKACANLVPMVSL